MNVLVVGHGGREHALCWKLRQSPLCKRLYGAPGNPGTAQVAENVDLAIDDFAGLVRFATEQQIRDVLSALTALRIRGEYLNATNETMRLDNVSMDAPPEPTPEPAALALMGTGLAGCAFYVRRRRRRRALRRRSRDCRHAYVEPSWISI
jgi:hypothetical protein